MKRRLSQAGFIRTVDYEDWISNIVQIAKKALCVYASSSLHRLPSTKLAQRLEKPAPALLPSTSAELSPGLTEPLPTTRHKG